MMKDKIKTQTKIFIYVDKVLKTKSKNGVLYKSRICVDTCLLSIYGESELIIEIT